MPNSIYAQMGQGLAQAARYGNREILYRGKVIECSVLIGVESTKLMAGGLQVDRTVHIKVGRQLVPIGQDGEPHTTERVVYPAAPTKDGLIPFTFQIEEVIAEEYAYNFTLVDPSK